MAGTVLEVRDLGLTVGAGIRVLDGLSFAVHDGEHLAILGPSGSGKSSLLKIIAGELQPTLGSVVVPGRVASIHQDFRLVESATAITNVLHGAAADAGLWHSLSGGTTADRQRGRDWLRRVGLASRADTRVDRLSGGERQRVALARALMRRPRVLLADEPVAALDAASAQALMQLLDELRRDEGLTVITVLHDGAIAARHADRVIQLQPELAAAATASDAGFSQARAGRRAQRPARWLLAGLASAAVALSCAAAASALDLQLPSGDVTANLGRFVGALVPTQAQLGAIDWRALGIALRDTLLMAWLATLAATVLALPLAAAAARNVGPPWLRVPVRALLNGIRAVPSILWALLAVGAFGLGALPGVLALAAYSLGYLTKFFYEALESVPPPVPAALRSLGMTRVQVFCSGIAPASRLALLSSSIFMLEYNFRTATVLGIVGAGGIGYELKLAIDWGNWYVVGVILALLVVAVTLFDALAARLRLMLA